MIRTLGFPYELHPSSCEEIVAHLEGDGSSVSHLTDVVQTGHVLVEHLPDTGRNDRIERPLGDAVPLFWRFVQEKFGVQSE